MEQVSCATSPPCRPPRPYRRLPPSALSTPAGVDRLGPLRGPQHDRLVRQPSAQCRQERSVVGAFARQLARAQHITDQLVVTPALTRVGTFRPQRQAPLLRVGRRPRHRPATTAWPIRRRVAERARHGIVRHLHSNQYRARAGAANRVQFTSVLPRAYPTMDAIVMRSLRGRERSVTGPCRSGNSSRPRSLHSSDLRFPAA